MGKRLWSVLGILLCVSLVPSAVYANIDNLSNMSAEWIRTGNRNAATDAADIVLYNPAGLTEMSEGVHLNISNQTLIRKPEHSFDLGVGDGPKHYEQDSPDYLLPNFFASWNKESWALFGGIYIPGGGAVVDYPDGSITTDIAAQGVLAAPADPDLPPGFTTMADVYTGLSNGCLEASSMYLTTSLGAAYKINDKISVAAGVRYIHAENTIEAEVVADDLTPAADVVNSLQPGAIPSTLGIDTEDDADGFGGVLGVNFNATDKLNLALNYQTRVKLDFETSVNRDDLGMFTDGAKSRRDFPAFLGLGAGYDVSEKVYVEVNGSYWFQKDADWGEDDAGRDISDMAGDAWSAGVALAYKLTPTLQVSGGTTYTKFEWDDINGYYNASLGSLEVLYSDNWHVGIGCAWEFMENYKLNVAVAKTIWDDETIDQAFGAGTIPVATENDTTVIAIGLDMAF